MKQEPSMKPSVADRIIGRLQEFTEALELRDIMPKQLTKLTKKELISIVQDYQEMISEIEELIDNNLSKAKLRDIMMKY